MTLDELHLLPGDLWRVKPRTAPYNEMPLLRPKPWAGFQVSGHPGGRRPGLWRRLSKGSIFLILAVTPNHHAVTEGTVNVLISHSDGLNWLLVSPIYIMEMFEKIQ